MVGTRVGSTHYSGHQSSSARAANQMSVFWDVLLVCKLSDLVFSSFPYTYNNVPCHTCNMCVCLDQSCVDEAWCSWFPSSCVMYLVTSRSDHCPLILHCGRGYGCLLAAGSTVWNHLRTWPDTHRECCQYMGHEVTSKWPRFGCYLTQRSHERVETVE